MLKQLVDQDILKATAANAYDEGYDRGRLDGKIYALHTLADGMMKQDMQSISGKLITELLKVLQKEKD